ncbi:MAG: MATE family efflux transporter [Clostridia bacterium]|jgi:putative efflux protein, MATE family|nr:MATE family efflux transporter [Clostridia bacterium]
MASGTMIRDLTRGNVVKQLFSFALPLFVSNALQAVYNLVDMVIVGHCIGPAGMSAVSIGGDLLHLLTFVAMGFSSAGQVIIARAVGADRREEIPRTIGTMFTFLLSVALVIALACFALRRSVLAWLNTPADSLSFALDYLVTCVCGLVFIYGYNIVSAILRGMGDSRRPFIFIAVAAVLNTVLDVLFVKYLGMAVFGAALATVIGQGVSFVASVVYLYFRRESFGFDFKPASFKVDPSAFKKLLALGVPMAIQSAAVSFSKIILMAWINLFDVTYSALAGVYNKINIMSGVISQAFTTAGSTMVGQNLGARQYGRVNRTLLTVLSVGLLMAFAATAVMLLWPRSVYELFTPDAGLLAVASVLTVPAIANFFGSATRSAAFSLINGSGRPKLNLAVAIIDGVCARIGLAYLMGFALKMDCFGFWMGDALAGFMPFMIGFAFYLSERWMEKRT